MVQLSNLDTLPRAESIRAMIRTEKMLREGISSSDVLYQCGRDGFVVLSTRAEAHEIAYLGKNLRTRVKEFSESENLPTELLLAAARPDSTTESFDDLLRTAHQNLRKLRDVRAAA